MCAIIVSAHGAAETVVEAATVLAAARAAAADLRVESNTQAISKPFGSERVAASVSV